LERQALVAELRTQGIADERVLAALEKVPRHAFVPARHTEFAYDNIALPLGGGQTVSQPFIVASMTEQARLTPEDRCLEIGTGSGYQAAVLAEMCRRVWSIEYQPELAAGAERVLRSLGYGPDRIELRTGNGWNGWPEHAPWDAILVTAAPDEVPRALLEQLALGGRLVVPVGDVTGSQQLEVWQRVGPGSRPWAFRRQVLYGVRFVPLVGGPRAPKTHG
jgi:protein-L-isoaspartate(D-aspartate) O-methyltransferase